MGKKTPAPPPAPDPVKVAAAQTASNVETARLNANLNRLDETDPMGSVRYTDLGGDHWRKDTALSPIGQRQFDLQNQVDEGTNRLALQGVGQAGKVLSTPFGFGSAVNERPAGLKGTNDVQRSLGNVGTVQQDIGDAGQVQRTIADSGPIQGMFGDAGKLQRAVGPNDFSADRQRVEGAILSRMEPAFARDRAGMEQRLADQGIPAGSEAYKRQMDELDRQKNDARQQAILSGGQEQSRLFGMDLQKGGFANDAQQAAYGQEMGRAGFANEAEQQRYAQQMGRAGLANEAQGQAFGQEQTRAGFTNDAQNQRFAQELARGQYGNQATAQQVNQAQAEHADYAGQRQRQIQEAMLLRSQPINEIGALLGTGQVGMPQFQQTTPVNVQGTDVIGAYGQAQAANQANYNAQNQANASKGSAMSSLAGTAATAAMFF